MKDNLKFIWLLIKLRLSHMMVFRLSFFGAFFADGMLFLVQLVTFQVIYGRVERIGDWSRGQMLIFIGTFSMINALNMVIYFFGVLSIPDKIRSGALDHYITKPGNALLRLSFEAVNPGSLPLVLFSAGIIAYGLRVQGVPVSVPLIFGYAALVLVMAVLYYDMELILRTIPFLLVGTSAIERLEGEMLTLNFQIPGVLFQGVFKVLFYFVMPYGVMATVPAQFVTGTLSGWGLAYALGLAVLFTGGALWFWRFGLSRYKSASS